MQKGVNGMAKQRVSGDLRAEVNAAFEKTSFMMELIKACNDMHIVNFLADKLLVCTREAFDAWCAFDAALEVSLQQSSEKKDS